MAESKVDFSFPDEIASDVATGLLRRGLVGFGDYTLRSGMWSPLYVDLRPAASALEENLTAPTMSKGEQLKFRRSAVLGYVGMLELLDDEFQHTQAVPEAMCGLAPMVAYEADVSYIHRRINPKDHGKKELFLGDFNPGDETVLVDDLISTSGAKIDEKKRIEATSSPKWTGEDLAFEEEIIEPGLIVKHALILLDRETGGIEAAAEQGLQVHAGLTITKVLEIGRAENVISDSDYRIAKAYLSGELTHQKDKHLFA